MKHLFSERWALAGVLTVLSLIVLFHLLILLGVIPFCMVWGGQLTDRAQMLRMESVSILLNLVMLAVAGVRGGYFGRGIPPRIITIALWIMTGLFALNTLGNLLSQNALEKIIFTPLTLILSLLCLRLAIGKGRQPAVGK